MDDGRYAGQQQIHGIQDGIVVANTNDEGSQEYVPGRIRVRIPTVCEPDSSWATPFGGAAGGGADTGMYMVPDVGSTVTCFFVEGDPDELYYAPAGWTLATLPEAVKEAIDEDGQGVASLITVWGNSRFEIVFDRRDEKGRLYIRSKRHAKDPNSGQGFMIEFDDETGLMGISAPGGVNINTLGKMVINARSGVEINGRVVNPMGDVI